MYQYPKQILTIDQQVQSYIDAGIVVASRADVEKALKSVGYYRSIFILSKLLENENNAYYNYFYLKNTQNREKREFS